MKSEGNVSRYPANTSKTRRSQAQKIATSHVLRKRTDFFSSLLDGGPWRFAPSAPYSMLIWRT
jgi:hypothetical protein